MFRGTDSSIVGWKEDFDMGYESPVPAQEEAVRYLEGIASRSIGPLRIAGHSKGGNLAAYAAAFCSKKTQDRIRRVCSFDGPGLSEEALESDGYKRIQPRLLSLIPKSSVVGMLLGYHTDYMVVEASKRGILQHDSFSWQLNGPVFVRAEDIDDKSAAFSDGMHQWLKDCTREERQTFVEAMFTVISATEAKTTGEIAAKKQEAINAMLTAMMKMDPELRRSALVSMGKLFADTSAASVQHFYKRASEFFDGLPQPNSMLGDIQNIM